MNNCIHPPKRQVSASGKVSKGTHQKKEWLSQEKWGCQGEISLSLYCLNDNLIKRIYSGTA